MGLLPAQFSVSHPSYVSAPQVANEFLTSSAEGSLFIVTPLPDGSMAKYISVFSAFPEEEVPTRTPTDTSQQDGGRAALDFLSAFESLLLALPMFLFERSLEKICAG